jgi:hypothetical protein
MFTGNSAAVHRDSADLKVPWRGRVDPHYRSSRTRDKAPLPRRLRQQQIDDQKPESVRFTVRRRVA